MKSLLTFSILSVLLALTANTARADGYEITIKDHRFSPEKLTIPADQKVKITIKNLDSTPAEFESHDLDREKVIGAQAEASLFVGPLKAGEYAFFDDFHRDTTKGTLAVK